MSLCVPSTMCFWYKEKKETNTFGKMAKNMNGRENSLKEAWGKVNEARHEITLGTRQSQEGHELTV